jgi:hypothetical protein
MSGERAKESLDETARSFGLAGAGDLTVDHLNRWIATATGGTPAEDGTAQPIDIAEFMDLLVGCTVVAFDRGEREVTVTEQLASYMRRASHAELGDLAGRMATVLAGVVRDRRYPPDGPPQVPPEGDLGRLVDAAADEFLDLTSWLIEDGHIPGAVAAEAEAAGAAHMPSDATPGSTGNGASQGDGVDAADEH